MCRNSINELFYVLGAGRFGTVNLTETALETVVYSCAGVLIPPGLETEEFQPAADGAVRSEYIGPWSNSTITVIGRDEPICYEQTLDGITWPKTAANGVSTQSCARNLTGF